MKTLVSIRFKLYRENQKTPLLFYFYFIKIRFNNFPLPTAATIAAMILLLFQILLSLFERPVAIHVIRNTVVPGLNLLTFLRKTDQADVNVISLLFFLLPPLLTTRKTVFNLKSYEESTILETCFMFNADPIAHVMEKVVLNHLSLNV
jgi:hypothetical protein